MPRLARAGVVAVFLLLAGAFAAYFLFTGYRNLSTDLRFSGRNVALAALLHVLFLVACTWAWRAVVVAVGARRPSWLDAFSHLVASGIAKYVPGKVWGPAARAVVMKGEGIDWSYALVAMAVEQYLLVHSSLVVMGLGAAVLRPSSFTYLLAGIAIASIPLGLYVLAAMRPLLQRLGHFDKLKPLAEALVRPLRIGVGAYLSLLGKYIVVWSSSGLVLVALYAAFFQPIHDYALLVAIVFANTVGIVLGFVALFAPGGLGVREGATALALTPYIGGQAALTLSILFRLWGVALELGMSLVLLRYVRPRAGADK